MIKIGFTGHKDVLEKDEKVFKYQLFELLSYITKKYDTHIAMYNAMADGADLWAADCLSKHDVLVVVDFNAGDDARNIPRHPDGPVIQRKNISRPGDKYINIQKYLLDECEHIIVAWDGIFTFQPGGTSFLVEQAMNSPTKKRLYQLITPREKNPYPVAAFIDDVVSFEDKKYNRFPIALHYSWIQMDVPFTIHTFRPKKSFLKEAGFWNYILPLFLIVVTVILGSIGFYSAYMCKPEDDYFNSFFRAINLITFNHSVLDEGIASNFWLLTARFLGVLIVFSGALFALSAVFKEQLEYVKLFWWRLFNDFYVVFGLNEKSFDLIMDLQCRKIKNVLVIDPECDEKYVSELSSMSNVIIRKHSITSSEYMSKNFVYESKHIFVFSDHESDVVRCVQELDTLSQATQNFPEIYVQLYSEQARRFVHDSASEVLKKKIIPFDIYENTVRRLLMYYPVDRFYQTPLADEAVVFVLGYGALGEKMVDYLMRIGHYGKNKKLTIRVICEHADREEENFYRKHPLARIHRDENTNLGRVTKYVWEDTSLIFEEAPLSIYDYIFDGGLFTKEITENKIVSIYALHPDGVESAKLLNEVLPRLNALKKKNNCNLQVFCYYNFPDKKEEMYIEKKFRKLAPDTFVVLFGNFLDECTLTYLQNNALDALPKMIHAVYNRIEPSDKNIDKIEAEWQTMKEEKKISNRMAADHLWIKIRSVWEEIGWENMDKQTMIPKNFDTLIQKGQSESLGQLEHKRWCADLLMQNTIPCEYDATDKKIRQKKVAEWVNPYKQKIIDQRYHIDLVPYELLHDDEKQKDKDQVEKIPEFLRAVIKPQAY